MAWFKRALRSGIALKAAQMVAREARKPENQHRAKEALAKVQQRRQRR